MAAFRIIKVSPLLTRHYLHFHGKDIRMQPPFDEKILTILVPLIKTSFSPSAFGARVPHGFSHYINLTRYSHDKLEAHDHCKSLEPISDTIYTRVPLQKTRYTALHAIVSCLICIVNFVWGHCPWEWQWQHDMRVRLLQVSCHCAFISARVHKRSRTLREHCR